MKKYNIIISGYGGEVTIGKLTDEQVEVIKKAKENDKSLEDLIWDDELDTSWHEIDDLYHNFNVGDVFHLLVEDDETKEEIVSLNEDILYSDTEILEYQDKYVDTLDPVLMCVSGEKGVFFEATLELEEEFDINKLKIMVDEEVGVSGYHFGNMLSRVSYDGEELDNWGGSTDGKYFEVYTNLNFD